MLRVIWKECPYVFMDYGFLGEREAEEQVTPVLAMRERRQNNVDDAGSEKRNGVSLDRKDSSEVQQPTRAQQRDCTSPPRRESDCARETASGRKSVQRDHRACGQDTEGCTGAPHSPDVRILCWLVGFAAYLMNRCDIGRDGKTPLQRLHRRRDNTPILEFGEKILYMPAKPARGGKSGNLDSIPECLLAC